MNRARTTLASIWYFGAKMHGLDINTHPTTVLWLMQPKQTEIEELLN